MERVEENTDAVAPLFSVIIPLEFHRDRWERCVQLLLRALVASTSLFAIYTLERIDTQLHEDTHL